jgi:hypothetical protein
MAGPVLMSAQRWIATAFAAATAAGATAQALQLYPIEYYHAARDQYFLATEAAEIKALDSGTWPGWSRTRVALEVSGSPYGFFDPLSEEFTPLPMEPVCRFYIPPALGDSHFFSASVAECTEVYAHFPAFMLESPTIFYVKLPDATSGDCSPGGPRVPVYRLWNARADTNHRYVTSLATRTQMIAKGWVPEGYGPMGVAFCVPAA